ncbi:MAG: hypothetical protein WAL75_24845 [Terracidiphilus sp.]
MDKDNQSQNQPASQTPSQVTAYPANRWQPVTDLYQQQVEGNGPAMVEPPKPAPVPVSQRDLPKSIVPMSLNIITGLYFVRAVVYFALGGKLLSNPNSDFSQWLVSMSGVIIPFTITHRHPEMFVRLVGEAMLVTAALSVVVGGMWLFRSWKIRWITMAYAGGMVLRGGVHYFAGVVSGVGSGLTADQDTILFFGCVINSLIFCYLAFYPGVKEAFEKPF